MAEVVGREWLRPESVVVEQGAIERLGGRVGAEEAPAQPCVRGPGLRRTLAETERVRGRPDIVERQPIRTQHELAAALHERGFRVTQATVSRDIGEIGLIKANRDGGTVYELPIGTGDAEATPEQRLRDLIGGLPLDILEAGLLLVLRAVPGSAHAIAAALDRCRWPEVAGSLAGKRVSPTGLGTMRTDNPTFVVLLIGIIILVGALTFFPALLLGPIVQGLTGHLYQ